MTPDYPKTLVSQVLRFGPQHTLLPGAAPTEVYLQTAIREVLGRFPTYGYRRVTAELHRRAWKVNRKRVACVMRELAGIRAAYPIA